MVNDGTRNEQELGARLQAGLPTALQVAFGVDVAACAIRPGQFSAHVAELADGFQVHLELEASLGPGAGATGQVVIVLPLEPGARLLGVSLPEGRQLASPDVQLQVLAELSEGTEAIAHLLAGVLAAPGSFLGLRVSGASLIEPGGVGPLPGDGTLTSYLAEVAFSGDDALVLIVAIADHIAAQLLAGGRPAARGESVERAARLSAATGSRRDAAPFAALEETERPTARPFPLEQLEEDVEPPLGPRGLEPILDVSLRLSVELGAVEMTVEEVLALGPGSVVELDRLAGEPVDVVVNNRVIARGEVVVVDESFGVRILEILGGRRHTAA